MEVKPGSQQTEVGVIPTDWDVALLRNACTLHNGRAYALHEWETTGCPVIRLQNLTGGEDYYYSNLKLPEEKYCKRGDLLFMWSATFGPRIWNGERAIYHYHIWKVTPYPRMATKEYLYYRLVELTEKKKARAANPENSSDLRNLRRL
jgi:type I restriction enzyme S subunit